MQSATRKSAPLKGGIKQAWMAGGEGIKKATACAFLQDIGKWAAGNFKGFFGWFFGGFLNFAPKKESCGTDAIEK
jgi:hypothetical protein